MQAGSQAGLEGRHPLDIPHIVWISFRTLGFPYPSNAAAQALQSVWSTLSTAVDFLHTFAALFHLILVLFYPTLIQQEPFSNAL